MSSALVLTRRFDGGAFYALGRNISYVLGAFASVVLLFGVFIFLMIVHVLNALRLMELFSFLYMAGHSLASSFSEWLVTFRERMAADFRAWRSRRFFMLDLSLVGLIVAVGLLALLIFR